METKIRPHWLLGQGTKQSKYHHTISPNPLFGLWMHSFSSLLKQDNAQEGYYLFSTE